MTLDRSAALCAQSDPEEWYPDKGRPAVASLRICRRCDQRIDCLREALENHERYGVWGGMTERQRRVLLRSPVQGCARPPAIAAVPDLHTPGRARRHHASQPHRANVGSKVA